LMPPKPKAVVGNVDGVPYSHNLASGLVVVGSGLVPNDRRDTFKVKAGNTLELQVRARPKFKELAAAATAAAGAAPPTVETQPSPEGSAPQAPLSQPAQQPAMVQQATAVAARAGAGCEAGRALEAAAKKSILFGGMRRQPTQVRNGDHGALRPALLESNLGIAWEPGRGGRAEAEREKASRAAQAEYQKKLDAAIAARKESAKRSREEPSRCCGGPCLCTPEGALEMLREERREWQTALDSTVKVAKGATFLARWLAQSGGAPAAE
jgi:hypothetical protein